MKIFHISDLHIGKQLNYYSLKENQEDILNQIIEQMKVHRPDVLLIAGDIFDTRNVSVTVRNMVTDIIWKNLNEDNKVSLFVRYIDLETNEVETRIVNKNV